MPKEQTEIMITKFKPLFILDNLVDTYDELLFANLNVEMKHRSSTVTEENFLEEYIFPFFDTLIVDNNLTVNDEIEKTIIKGLFNDDEPIFVVYDNSSNIVAMLYGYTSFDKKGFIVTNALINEEYREKNLFVYMILIIKSSYEYITFITDNTYTNIPHEVEVLLEYDIIYTKDNLNIICIGNQNYRDVGIISMKTYNYERKDVIGSYSF